ncbi:hypothetical protein A3739_03310 [Oleiphilus sp. HI0067]|nr:hypothetical protein A3739_03310 [Oleiphilus sp. HI0067]
MENEMNTHSIKKTAFAAVLATAMSQAAFAQSSASSDAPLNEDSNSGTYWGVGIGTALGAIIGGPVGAAAGAALGGSFGYGHDQGEALEVSENQLDAQTMTLAKLESKYVQSQRTISKLKVKNANITRENALQASELADLRAQEITEREQAEILSNIAKHYSQEIYYRHNESSIPDYAKARIDELSGFMQVHPSIAINLHGHTDLLGPEQTNKALSQARVDALKDYLVESGIAASRIQTNAHGEAFATVTSGDAGNYVLDRRVAIELSMPSAEPQPVVMHAGDR